jgi:hypothetical protein
VLHVLTKRQEALPAPAGATSRGATGGAGGVGVVAADEVVAAPGSTSSRSATSTTAFGSEWLGQDVVLTPATFPLTSASFAASTADDANSASAATVSPPSAPSGWGRTW